MIAYLDYNATAPLRPEALDAMTRAVAEPGNASSVHAAGRRARRLVEEAREKVAALAAVDPRWVIFTSGGTEANNLALGGLAAGPRLVSATEHDSVLQAAPQAERLAVRPDGQIDLDALEEALRGQPAGALVSVMLANNETGVLQPMEAVVERAKAAGALVHCDAVQAAGKLPLDMVRLGVDCMTLSSHKLGGPPGVGALLCRDNLPLTPLLQGGGQERQRRPGTENLPGIAGFGAAAEAALRDLPQVGSIAGLRDSLETGAQTIAPEVRVFGAESARLANTSCLALAGMAAETQIMALDLAGVAVSAGAACSSGKVRPSHVLTAMGASAGEAASAIRVSLGWRSSTDDVDRFLAAWGDLYRRSQAA
ncbi:cysteine desulfurase [Pelagibius litoralis]|uniref:Cysteine desulfurase n=1 Tax=Pelagibius litoralis TaxID=374515 RepID=A0A967EVK5_9PROT|nr:cysteine desulfurase family protein [Pelagibius litoralis]NIA68796.1 cysteine desulfurase [Pelagibius litoralis]